MKFIALRSIERDSGANYADEEQTPRSGIVRRQSTTVDESREKGQKFVNPSLVVPLEKMWINSRPRQTTARSDSNGGSAILDREESAPSTVGMGDTHVWRDNSA